jgi:hypothetical protein
MNRILLSETLFVQPIRTLRMTPLGRNDRPMGCKELPIAVSNDDSPPPKETGV